MHKSSRNSAKVSSGERRERNYSKNLIAKREVKKQEKSILKVRTGGKGTKINKTELI